MKPAVPGELLAEFGVSAPQWVAETPIAVVWKVQRADGRAAALKLYKESGMGSEAAGFAYLRHANTAQAARVYAVSDTAALVEWLDGPSLGDVAREGGLADADQKLAETARSLHACVRGPIPSLMPLEERFAALLKCPEEELPAGSLRSAMMRSRAIAASLLKDQQDACALHGDLHHENVRQGARGFCAFDAKGLWGERSYELANALRHPQGCREDICSPEVIRRRADLWAASLNTSAGRLLAWAAAKSALSISWRLSANTTTSDPEEALLAALLEAFSERI